MSLARRGLATNAAGKAVERRAGRRLLIALERSDAALTGRFYRQFEQSHHRSRVGDGVGRRTRVLQARAWCGASSSTSSIAEG